MHHILPDNEVLRASAWGHESLWPESHPQLRQAWPEKPKREGMGTPGKEEEMVKAEVRHQGDLREPELLSTMVYADARSEFFIHHNKGVVLSCNRKYTLGG